MKKYGLTGNPLGHSISPEIHGLLNNKAEYKLYPATDLKGEFLTKLSKLDGFNVTVPYGTHVCYIAGSPSWEHLKMQKVDDTHFTLTTDELDGLAYKYCAGDTWTFVEKLADGAHPDDREYAESDVVVAWNAIQDPEITILELEDDAAYANWGGDWRMPTIDEIDELVDNCTWTWTTQNGVNGYKVSSKVNANSIFLPAAGYRYSSDMYYAGSSGSYWSSSLGTSSSNSACSLFFGSSNVDWGNNYLRDYGRSVRAVLR